MTVDRFHKAAQFVEENLQAVKVGWEFQLEADALVLMADAEELPSDLPYKVVDIPTALILAIGNEPLEVIAQWEPDERRELAAHMLGMSCPDTAHLVQPSPSSRFDGEDVPWMRLEFDTPSLPLDWIEPDDLSSALRRLGKGVDPSDIWK